MCGEKEITKTKMDELISAMNRLSSALERIEFSKDPFMPTPFDEWPGLPETQLTTEGARD